MEFFADTPDLKTTAKALHDFLSIERLPVLCPSIDTVLSQQSERQGEIYCVWGQFDITREPIRYGVRFSLLNCPHALTWTITTHAEREVVVTHCTIDKREIDPDFAESVEQFVSEFAEGIRALS